MRPRLVEALIRAGAAGDVRSGVREDALWAAASKAEPDLLRTVLKLNPVVDANPGGGMTPLMAVGGGGTDGDHNKLVATVRQLLAEGFDPNARDDRRETPLFHVNDPEVVRLIVKAGGDLNARNQNGQTPILASYDDDLVVELINLGADVTVKDRDGKNVEFYAQDR